MKAVLLKQNSKIPSRPSAEVLPHDIDEKNTLQSFYDAIGCSTIDIVSIKIVGKDYDIVCDDEGLLKEVPVPTLYINDDLVLFGNLVFTKHDNEGRTVGLNQEDAKIIYRFLKEQDTKLVRWVRQMVEVAQSRMA